MLDPVVGGLAIDPLRELGQPLDEVLARREAELLPGEPRVAEAVADIADPRLAEDLGGDAVLAHRPGQPFGDFGHAAVASRSDVEGAARRLRQLERVGTGAGDI